MENSLCPDLIAGWSAEDDVHHESAEPSGCIQGWVCPEMSLTNVVEHAGGAARAEATLRYEPGTWLLRWSTTGRGPVASTERATGGHGHLGFASGSRHGMDT